MEGCKDWYMQDIEEGARHGDWGNGSFFNVLATYHLQDTAKSGKSHHRHGHSGHKGDRKRTDEQSSKSTKPSKQHHSKVNALPSGSNPGQVHPSHGPAMPSAPTEDPRQDPRLAAALAQAAFQAQSQESTARASALRTYPPPGSTYPSRGPPAATAFTNGPASTVRTDAQPTGRHFPSYAESQYPRFPTQCTDSAAAPGYDAAEDWAEESFDEAEE